METALGAAVPTPPCWAAAVCRGFRAGNVRVEKELVTRVTVCVELLSRFSESSVPVSKGAG